MLLGSPVLVAYGLAVRAEALYYLAVVPLLAAFVGLPGALGGMLAVGIGYLLPRRPKTSLAVLAAVVETHPG